MEGYAVGLRERDISGFIDFSKPLRILDMANGQLCPQYYLLKAEGHQVTGIDLVNGRNTSWIDRGYRVARWIYAWYANDRKGRLDESTLVCGDVSRLPFMDGYFDLVTSIAAFEHFQNVPAVVSEMQRVMKPGGVAWISIHPFTSLSGAHNLRWKIGPISELPHGVDAWDHLREQKLPVPDSVNRWRIDQYLNVFVNYLEILKSYCFMVEGENLLMPKIIAELSAYSRVELICATYIVLARKR